MALLERIQTDMVAAMRAKDEARLNAIRLIKTALKKHEVDSMKPLDETTELQILSTLIKQRREAAEMFRKGGWQGAERKGAGEISVTGFSFLNFRHGGAVICRSPLRRIFVHS